MKVIAINGSPRKDWNTAKALNKALEGAASKGAETKMVNLYDLEYKGCISCFYCKRKDKKHGICAMKDDLSPILEEIKGADAIILGSPLYYMSITSGLAAFLERFMFSNMIYSPTIPTVFPKKMRSAFIYTMNITEERMESIGLKNSLKAHEMFIGNILQVPPESLGVYNTYQFSDYEKYESSMFSEKDKARYRDEQFPKDLKKAFLLGVRMTEKIQ